ncbi:hypothetical protein ACFSWE_04085 [Leucobacter albus]|uniref:Uncharacterized protein n=1 Tax=Leucobacter albus TaxID=272210 RepID=A0ABW3TNB0_9MICO
MRQAEERLRRELQNYTDANFGEPYQTGASTEVENAFAAWESIALLAMPQSPDAPPPAYDEYPDQYESEDEANKWAREHQHMVEEWESFEAWLIEIRDEMLHPKVNRQLTTHEREKRGYSNDRALTF